MVQELPQEHWQHQPPSHPGHGYALAHSQPVPEEAYVSPAQYRSLGIFRADRVSPSLTNGGESVAPLFAADPQKTSDETFPIPLHDYHAYAM
ncbi:hypothetical protein C8Q80DRAFT_132616 [Daedaleopsis nitida]|nr:hypothetical protein C8Q80DRAFT_132616 [Daedaleopsis nitida]